MVKGVNKTVIEVNNTGSKVFEKIVFYVSPSCGNLNPKHLKRAMQSFTFQFDERAGGGYKTLRQRMIMRRRIFIGATAGIIAFAAVMLVILL